MYKDNLTHRKKYNGRLYNIVDSDIALTPAPQGTERKGVKRAVRQSITKTEEDKPEKGLKKFLDKVFVET
ncbi:MAG: hypothetical protein WKG06_01300 [Segetibacter sp.]